MNAIISTIKHFAIKLILVFDKAPTKIDNVKYAVEVTPVLTGVAYLFDSLNIWFGVNKLFVTCLWATVFINIGYGMYYHYSTKTFDVGELLRKASKMIFSILIAYILLDMVRAVGGENLGTEIFRRVIQVMSLMYPTSKTLKQMYILNNKEFPPKWVMERVYKFEKQGDIAALFKTGVDTQPPPENNINDQENPQ